MNGVWKEWDVGEGGVWRTWIFIRGLSDMWGLSNWTVYTKPHHHLSRSWIQSPMENNLLRTAEAEPLNINSQVHWRLYFYLFFTSRFPVTGLVLPNSPFLALALRSQGRVTDYVGWYKSYQTALCRNGEQLFKYQSKGARAERNF